MSMPPPQGAFCQLPVESVLSTNSGPDPVPGMRDTAVDHTDEDSVLRADILMRKIENQQIQVFHRVCQAVTQAESKMSGNGRGGVGEGAILK